MLMNPQVVLIIAGLVLIVLAILGSGDFVKVVIPSLSTWARISLAIVGIGVFVLAFIPGIVNNSSPGSPISGVTTPQATATPAARSPSQAVQTGPVVTLSSPITGTNVSRSQGFIATGRAESLGTYTVWILDYDGGYTVDQEATLASGQWSAVDKPLGDTSDHLPYYLTMRVIIGNHKCAARLQQVSSTNNDYIPQLPDGCKYVSGTTVHVTKP
jgi:hypothetical protein